MSGQADARSPASRPAPGESAARPPKPEMARLCIHTATNRPLGLELMVDEYARAGVAGITVWRDAFQSAGLTPRAAGERIRGAGLEIVSLCRGGFFVSPDEAARTAAIDENRTIVREASELGAPLVVLVVGADPAVPLPQAREQIRAGIEAVLPIAEDLGVRLAIEPLHPMYADTRSAVTDLATANTMVEAIGSGMVGVAVDVYHLWFDPALEREIARAGSAGSVFAFHVCDWRTPTRDLLTDRGLMGEGCIDIPRIRGWVEAAGFAGFNEVEIFSAEYWAMDQRAYIERIVDAYEAHV